MTRAGGSSWWRSHCRARTFIVAKELISSSLERIIMAAPNAAVLEASALYKLPSGFKPAYGTAGFRAQAQLLDSTVFRCGILMAIRALQTRQVTGICITASHNPAPDNGVKLVEPTGEMLQQVYEPVADELANAASDEALAQLVASLLEREGIAAGDAAGAVLIAHDTRPSGPSLAAAAAAGVQSLGLEARMLGLLTTPQLHWIVMRTNRSEPAGEEDYYATLASAFATLVRPAPSPPQTLYVDCANGVGAPKLAALAPHLLPAGLALAPRNTGGGVLNGGCGSDFLQGHRCVPAGFDDVPAGARCCAVDGDADRLMFFEPAAAGKSLCRFRRRRDIVNVDINIKPFFFQAVGSNAYTGVKSDTRHCLFRYFILVSNRPFFHQFIQVHRCKNIDTIAVFLFCALRLFVLLFCDQRCSDRRSFANICFRAFLLRFCFGYLLLFFLLPLLLLLLFAVFLLFLLLFFPRSLFFFYQFVRILIIIALIFGRRLIMLMLMSVLFVLFLPWLRVCAIGKACCQ